MRHILGLKKHGHHSGGKIPVKLDLHLVFSFVPVLIIFFFWDPSLHYFIVVFFVVSGVCWMSCQGGQFDGCLSGKRGGRVLPVESHGAGGNVESVEQVI